MTRDEEQLLLFGGAAAAALSAPASLPEPDTSALQGVVVAVDPDWSGPRASALIVITDQPDLLSNYAQAARINANSTGQILSVDEDEYAIDGEFDTDHFTLGDRVWIVDARLSTLRGKRTVLAVTSDSITLSSPITVFEDDRVISADALEASSAQLARQAYCASGDITEEPAVGSGDVDDTYKWGG